MDGGFCWWGLIVVNLRVVNVGAEKSGEFDVYGGYYTFMVRVVV